MGRSAQPLGKRSHGGSRRPYAKVGICLALTYGHVPMAYGGPYYGAATGSYGLQTVRDLKSGEELFPNDAVDMQARICVVAHVGAAGHRRVQATTLSVSEVFEWTTLKTNVKNFVTAFLHCMVVDVESVPRPWGEALHATKPNELIHFDWVSFPEAADGLKHVLVIKDDMSGFVRFHASATATAAAFMEWFGLFGVMKTCCELLHRTDVENTVQRDWLQPTEWPKVLPPVQSALNQQPADRMGGIAPTKAFTGLPATPPLSGLVRAECAEVATIDWICERLVCDAQTSE
ncbi:hypothetical protein H257_17196 [Aphanomyces astaci]|uniref:Integrase catalytic domain-containing protein n=1 Tax=Aphanomyces astaci TaxID=112090 RepID=W4FHR8_APHAT|nr:hypothetical protein H257_17196 [Aphanomyces astaci]ETV66293.1 hypothetical protein H257_17196 [Aphanomyces astaci]|eukprot:XP_009844199.1 hypothetical protein H257_17196 [Aphanomyces astaci]